MSVAKWTKYSEQELKIMVKESNSYADFAEKMGKEDIEEKLWNKRSELNTETTDIKMAINDLTNALNHLGERTEIYWG